MTELYISSASFNSDKLADVLVDNGVNSNIYTNISTVFDKANGVNKIENGAKVDIFEIETPALFDLYNDLVDKMGINCVYVNRGDFKDCITKMDGYLLHCEKQDHNVRSCSMY